MKLATAEREEQARLSELVDKWECKRQQERLDEAFRVYTRKFEAGRSGDDYVRGWESTKVQILGLSAA